MHPYTSSSAGLLLLRPGPAGSPRRPGPPRPRLLEALLLITVGLGILAIATAWCTAADYHPRDYRPPFPAGILAEHVVSNVQAWDAEGWRPGNPHQHTKYSFDCSREPGTILLTYRSCRYDWVALTDHLMDDLWVGPVWVDRSISTAEFRELADDLDHEWNDCCIPPAGLLGVEYSAEEAQGDEAHILALYPSPAGFMEDSCDRYAWEVMDGARRVGAFPIVAHPAHAQFGLDPSSADDIVGTMGSRTFGVEIINGSWGTSPGNSDAGNLRAWVEWFLLRGSRAFPTFGNDVHDKLEDIPRYYQGGTVVYASGALEPGTILGALKSGRLYVSTGPGLAMWVSHPAPATCETRYAWMGEETMVTRHTPVRVDLGFNMPVAVMDAGGAFRLRVFMGWNGAGGEVRVGEDTVIDRSNYGSYFLSEPLGGTLAVEGLDLPDLDCVYLRAEMVELDPAGRETGHRAYTSPVWVRQVADARPPVNLRARSLGGNRVEIAWDLAEEGGIEPHHVVLRYSCTATDTPCHPGALDTRWPYVSQSISPASRSIVWDGWDPTRPVRFLAYSCRAFDGGYVPGRLSNPAALDPVKLALPCNVSLRAVSKSALRLDFGPPCGGGGVSGFELAWVVQDGGLSAWWPRVLGPETRSFTADNLDCRFPHRFGVRAFRDPSVAGQPRLHSDWVTREGCPFWCSPRNLRSTAVRPDAVGLQWSDYLSPKVPYTIERSADGSTWTAVAAVPAPSCASLLFDASGEDTTAACATAYRYRVLRQEGGAEPSEPVSVTTGPAAVDSVSATVAGIGWSRLRWSYPGCTCGTRSGVLRIERRLVGLSTWEFVKTVAVGATAAAYEVTVPVPNCESVQFRVRAEVNIAGVTHAGAWGYSLAHTTFCGPGM